MSNEIAVLPDHCFPDPVYLINIIDHNTNFYLFFLRRFDIIKKLGQGTYGKVQLGINKETGQEVAIKTIKKCKIETEADLIRIRREIQIMSSVQHPNIIHIYEGTVKPINKNKRQDNFVNVFILFNLTFHFLQFSRTRKKWYW